MNKVIKPSVSYVTVQRISRTCLLVMFTGLALPAAAPSPSARGARLVLNDARRRFFVRSRRLRRNVRLPGHGPGGHRCPATASRNDLRRSRRLFTTICHTRLTGCTETKQELGFGTAQ